MTGPNLGGRSLAWRLSNTLDSAFCLDALEEALSKGTPEVFNTGDVFARLLKDRGIQVSHDGKGRYTDNIFVERLWRSLKYEEVYLKMYRDVPEARVRIGTYLWFYNEQRPARPCGTGPRRGLPIKWTGGGTLV